MPNPPSTDYDRAARLLFHGFFSKPTSFARLRRVWETTRQFWEQGQASLPDVLARRRFRLVLRGQLSQSLGPSHVYDVQVAKVETSLVWDGQRLISADNLRYLAKQLGLEEAAAADERVAAEAVKQRLEAESQLTLLETRSQQGRPQPAAILRHFGVELEEHNYPPAIPLLAEPQVFMALVPADRALEVIKFVAPANEDTAAGGNPLVHRPHRWQAVHPMNPTVLCDLVHVSELCPGDTVLYAPSTFDFEFLDVAGRRFELNYSADGVRLPSAHRRHPATRPLLLEEIADLETVWAALQLLTESQRRFLVSIVETKRTEWHVTAADDPTLHRFASDTLRQVGDGWWSSLADDETRRLLQGWATNGRLADVVELYEQMLKT
ncbi:MAG TPA: hypothetical protein VNP04_29560 [Alphaproteobacteria bacterium]|nr:hypothetical protein [Alphaproteobacteria bacterium]